MAITLPRHVEHDRKNDCLLEQIVVERPEKLGCKKWQETPGFQKGRELHVGFRVRIG